MKAGMSLELQGIGASDGLFLGPVRSLHAVTKRRIPSGDSVAEREALTAAIAAAIAELSDLMTQVDGDAADILAFQVAMLEDDSLSAPALASIETGEPADIAWTTALHPEIEGYEASDDDYFRARAADLKDLRDRVLRHLVGEAETSRSDGMVLVGDDLAPTIFLETDWSRGGAIALSGGSTTSHVAMLARARGIPMVVGLGDAIVGSTAMLAIDGATGRVIVDPHPDECSDFRIRHAADVERRRAENHHLLDPACRGSGERIEILINVAAVEELDHIDVRSCDGIGLMRSEFLFRDGAPLPDEEQQYKAYRRFVEWADGRPVTIRTLDIGGDKPVSGLTPAGERNPFLGLRGVRLTLSRPDVFRTQLRALARTAAHGPLKIMIPMVTIPDELDQTAELLDACVAELAQEGIAAIRPPLGIMVEVPAVAIAPDFFSKADFFSIGSNDLTQYVTATSRDDANVAPLNDAGHPAVTRLIASVAGYGRAQGIPVSLCGDMASDPQFLKGLLDAGLSSLSVAPARLGRIKAALRTL